MGWYNEKKENDRSACRREEKRWVFSIILKEERRKLDRESKRVLDDRSDALKGPSPQGHPDHHSDTGYPRLSEERRIGRKA